MGERGVRLLRSCGSDTYHRSSKTAGGLVVFSPIQRGEVVMAEVRGGSIAPHHTEGRGLVPRG